MIIDALARFSSDQAVTSTAISNVIDLNPNGGPNTLKDLGAGKPLYLVIITKTACTDSGSDATVAFSLESDSTADLATSATVHWTSGAIAFAAFSPAGTRVAAVALPISKTYERYLGVRYTVASGPLTAGAFDAFLVSDVQSWAAYADNITIN
jgi:hypothetical protein